MPSVMSKLPKTVLKWMVKKKREDRKKWETVCDQIFHSKVVQSVDDIEKQTNLIW